VVNIASTAGLEGALLPNGAAYSSSKSGLHTPHQGEGAPGTPVHPPDLEIPSVVYVASTAGLEGASLLPTAALIRLTKVRQLCHWASLGPGRRARDAVSRTQSAECRAPYAELLGTKCTLAPSTGGRNSFAESGLYCSRPLIQAMAIELGEYGVRCNAIAPGIFESDITQVRLGSVQYNDIAPGTHLRPGPVQYSTRHDRAVCTISSEV